MHSCVVLFCGPASILPTRITSLAKHVNPRFFVDSLSVIFPLHNPLPFVPPFADDYRLEMGIGVFADLNYLSFPLPDQPEFWKPAPHSARLEVNQTVAG